MRGKIILVFCFVLIFSGSFVSAGIFDWMTGRVVDGFEIEVDSSGDVSQVSQVSQISEVSISLIPSSTEFNLGDNLFFEVKFLNNNRNQSKNFYAWYAIWDNLNGENVYFSKRYGKITLGPLEEISYKDIGLKIPNDVKYLGDYKLEVGLGDSLSSLWTRESFSFSVDEKIGVCNNNLIEGLEVCDGIDLNSENCFTQGLNFGVLSCLNDCSGYDTSGCSSFVCNNNLIEGLEVCDGIDLNSENCVTQGFNSGVLSCLNDCSGYDTSGCSSFVCNNNLIEGLEVCDGIDLNSQTCITQGYDSGTLGCLNDCTGYDTSICISIVPCVDLDGDGYGNPASSSCTYPELDCDDSDTFIYEGHPEICDNKDNDCDGSVDTVNEFPLIYLDNMCFEGALIKSEEILTGSNFEFNPGTLYWTLNTIEHLDLSDKSGKEIQVYVYSDNYDVGLSIYDTFLSDEVSDWTGRLYSFENKINPFVTLPILPIGDYGKLSPFEPGPIISPAGEYSLLYTTKPNLDNVPEDLIVNRVIRFLDSGFYAEPDKTVIVDYREIRRELNDFVKDPQQFFIDVNSAYDEYKELVGHDTDILKEGKLVIKVEDINLCGQAGNPIIMDIHCLAYEEEPGFAVLHELGHMLTNGDALNAMYEGGCSCELWASFLAFYAYDIGLFDQKYTGYDRAYFDGKVADYNNKKEQALIEGYGDVYIGLLLELKDKYGWDMFKNFFRKYLHKPLESGTYEERQKYFVKSLAESAMEITGNQVDYDYVVNMWEEWYFPRP
jgi:hypothetical protein